MDPPILSIHINLLHLDTHPNPQYHCPNTNHQRTAREALFRASFPYEVPALSVVYNHLFMARMLYDDARFIRVLKCWREEGFDVDEAVVELLRSNIAQWVAWMRSRQERSANDIFDHFGIDW